MAFKQDELEFWLPSDVLADEDTSMESLFRCSDSASSRFLLPTELVKPLTDGSALSSPGKSFVGSTETESDEDVYLLSELTRQLALLDGHKFTSTRPIHEKNYVHSGSPQSTLFHVESFSGRSTGSSNGSPNGSSQVSSPPTTPLARNNSSWDLIYKAAGLVESLKSNTAGGLTATNSGAIFQRQGSFSLLPPLNSSNHSSVYPNYHLQGEELLGREGYGINGPKISGLTVNSGGWQPPYVYRGYSNNPQFGNKNHHLLPGPVARVSCGVHLGHGYGYGTGNRVPAGGGAVKSERVGTGVFLPRRYDGKNNGNSHCNGADTRKKSGNYSSIYSNNKKVPPPMNKNLNNGNKDALLIRRTSVSVPTIQRNTTLFHERPIHHEICLPQESIRKTSVSVSVPTTQRKTTSFSEGPIHHEICLPQEWTY